MSDDTDATKARFGRYLGVLAFVSMLAFVFLNYRDPWPPLVSPPLSPEPEIPRASNSNRLSLAPPPSGEADAPGHSGSSAAGADSVPTTSLPLSLLATLVQEDPSRSLARIADAQLPAGQMLLQGQVFEGRPYVKLVTIESDAVLLDNYGTLERLPLEPGGIRLTADSSRQPSSEPAFERTDEIRAQRREQLRELTDAGPRDPLTERGGLLEDVDVNPLYDDGAIVGVQLNAIRPDSLFDRAGLRDGDVVRSVNGVSLSDPNAGAALLDQIASGKPLRVAVERSDGSTSMVPLPTRELLRGAADIDGLDELPPEALKALGAPGGP